MTDTLTEETTEVLEPISKQESASALIDAKLDEYRIKLEKEYLDQSTEEEEQSFSNYAEIVKVDNENHFVLAPVLIPEVTDLQGDIVSADEIEKAAHGFISDIRKRDEDTDLQHVIPVGEDRVRLVESYIQRGDTKFGTHTVKSGTWLAGFEILDKDIWKAITDGAFSGFSIFGKATSEPA